LRYTETEELLEYGSRIKFKPLQLAFVPRYNIAPTQLAPVVIEEGGERIPRLMRWGLIPFWAKDESIGFKTINARADTVATKPAYRAAFKQRCCLVLADGFCEWKKVGKAKLPFRFVLKGQGPFAFAGLWERWKKPDGDELQTFNIITTEPNELTGKIHDRMPVILPAEHYDRWLDPKFQDQASLQAMLKPYAAEAMECYEVNPVVNNPRNEGSQCIEPA
jgi:putative SOS response-associated peptidase YedK